MGNLSRGHIVEFALWLAFAIFLFVFSFEFNQPIEIYKFGASAWPRAIILMMVLAAFGNLYWHWRFGVGAGPEAGGADAGGPGDGETGPAGTGRTGGHFRLATILLLPFAYAYLMESIGFYTLTPFFIAAVIFLMGERRLALIAIVSLVSYGLILLLFAKLLYVGLPVGTMHPFYDYSNWLLAILQKTS